MKIISRKEAVEMGLKSYFTGNPCRNGHLEERQTVNSTCKECARLRMLKYREGDIEKFRKRGRDGYIRNKARCQAYQQEYREKHPDKIRERQKAYCLKNAESKRQYTREWAKANPERRKAQKIKWHEEKPEHIRQYFQNRYESSKDIVKARAARWREENRDQKNANSRNREALKRLTGGTHSAQDIVRIMFEQNGCCAYCQSKILERNFHVDHIHPISRGGSNWPSNLCVCCPGCNIRKRARTGDEYRLLIMCEISSDHPAYAGELGATQVAA